MITILDENLKKICILKKCTYESYESKCREIGTFSLKAELCSDNMYLLDKTKQYFVLFDDNTFGKVTSVSKSSDSDYENSLDISGDLSVYILNKRIIKGTEVFSNVYTYQIIAKLIKDQMIENSDVSRNINATLVYDEDVLKERCTFVTSKQITGGYIFDEISDYLEQDKLIIRIEPNVVPLTIINDVQTNIDGFKIYIEAGVDRTKSNEDDNIPIVFSQMLSNIERTDYERDVSNETSVAYVAGEENEGEERKWFTVYRDESDKKSGWLLNELWVDARDIQSEEDGKILTDEEYEQLIIERANEKFAENDLSEEFEATLTDHVSQYQLGIDYNLGDFVTIIDKELGIVVDAQVYGVNRVLEESGQVIDVEFSYGKIRSTNIVQNVNDLKSSMYNSDVSINYLMKKVKPSAIVNLIYPVGSIYMSTNSTSPETLFGGTWEQIKDTFLLSAGDTWTAGSTGGNKDAIVPYHNHSFTGSEVTSGGPSNNTSGGPSNNTSGTPSTNSTDTQGAHQHTPTNNMFAITNNSAAVISTAVSSGHANISGYNQFTSSAGSHSHSLQNHTHSLQSHTHSLSSHTHTVTASGTVGYAGTSGNTTNANMPPYLTVYMWKRTA